MEFSEIAKEDISTIKDTDKDIAEKKGELNKDIAKAKESIFPDFFKDIKLVSNTETNNENTDKVKRNLDNKDDIFPDFFKEIKLVGVDFTGESVQNDADESKKNFDDNGNLYRNGDDLLPNNNYEINGYNYETDDKGRIKSAEGKLYIKDREERLTIKDSIETIGKGDQKEGDDRGHLIGDRFNGSNGLENLVPQDANINRKDYKNLENELAKEVKDGKDVYIKIYVEYPEDSRRPEAIVVIYSIDGKENIRIFPND
nr:DNA/RNA non-specific endonuclease [uncultured Lachnoanaerobaculum sp.]